MLVDLWFLIFLVQYLNLISHFKIIQPVLWLAWLPQLPLGKQARREAILDWGANLPKAKVKH